MKRTFLILATAATLLGAVDFAEEGTRWWAHIQYLADDKLEGRNTGTDGYRKAVQYVAGEFEKFGLKPAGSDGYLQQVKFETRQLVEKDSSLEIVRDGKAEPLKLGEEANLSPRADLAPSIEAGMVFVGTGLHIPEAKYDDLAGIDLKGKIAVYVNGGGPKDIPGNLKSHYSSGVERWNALRDAGAIGMATIAGIGPGPNGAAPAATGGGGGRGRGRGGEARPATPPSIAIADPELQETSGMKVSLTITRAGAEKFLAGSGHTVEELQKLANANQQLPRFPLVGTVRAKAAIERGELSAPNVVGILPGTDPKFKDEYVVMSAHLDHLGVGRAVNGDAIYNGAMDDASGIASILEIAHILKESGARTKRSIIFLAVTGEEKGELGSRYYAARPTVPAKQIVADVNLDMFLPLYALKVIEVQGLDESSLGKTVTAAAQEFGVKVQNDREPEQNRFIRSDQYSFIRNGVPALAFKFGYEFGSPDEKIRRDWVRDRYHKPSDDLSQPVDKEAAAKFDRIIASLLTRVANAEERPTWNADSFFRRFAKGV
jgi:hypothetical protein